MYQGGDRSRRDRARQRSASRDPEAGQTTLEYAVIVAIIAVGVVAGTIFLGTRVGDRYTDAGGAPLTPPVAQCDPNYSGACLPEHPPDVDCRYLKRLGVSQVTVVGSDPHGLDPDGDGIGCN